MHAVEKEPYWACGCKAVLCPAFHICPRVSVPLLCWFSVFFFFFHVYGCFACVYACAHGGQKGASDPLELGNKCAGCHVGAQSQAWALGRAAEL